MKDKIRRRIGLLPLLLALLAPLLITAGSGQAQGIFADGTFSRIWEKTDRIVQVAPGTRSWFWGPTAGAIKSEQYQQGAGGKRLVQYFDKARMEINNPGGDKNSEWYVTTGLLVTELVSGQQQIGDHDFVNRGPAAIPVAGDANDGNAPTYASFNAVASINSNNRVESRIGSAVTATINRAGQLGSDDSRSGDSNSFIVAYNDIFGHNIPRAIWEFMNQGGPILQDGNITYVRPVTNWIYTMGYPISEPYWSRVLADGKPIDVLIQLFERRALVFIPSYQAPWNVQMANVGAQYYQWVYNEPLPPAQNGPAATNTPLPPTNTPVPPTNTAAPSATNTPILTQTPVPGTPGALQNVDGSVVPDQGPPGTVFKFYIYNFRSVEGVTAQFTEPSGRSFDTGLNRVTTANGDLRDINIDSTGFTSGLWTITFVGSASKHTSIIYFRVGPAPTQPATNTPPPTVTPTRPPATATNTPQPSQPTNTPAPAQPTNTPVPGAPTSTPVPGGSLAVSPSDGTKDTNFTFNGSGFSAGEKVDFWFVDPTNSYWYPGAGRQLTATGSGAISLQVVPYNAFADVKPGTWTFFVEGRTSRKTANVRFIIH